MDRLERSLEGSIDDLSATLREAQDLQAKSSTDRAQASKDRAAAKREADARAKRNPNVRGTAAEGIPVEEIQAQSRVLSDQAGVEERLARATRDRANATTEAAEAVRRARANEYLNRAGLGETTAPGRAVSPIEAAAARVEAQVAAARAASFANQYPSPIGPQPRGGVKQYASPIGPTSPQQVQQAAVAAQRLAEENSLLVERAIETGDATQRVNGLFAEQARALGLADDAYTRHGYLTSEFISAAARGQVTFAQLGTQVGGTIAKFAGWTAAATAVYAAVGALHELNQGAIQAASGVGLINRVKTTELPGGSQELQQRFRDLSRQFNLPVEDVVQSTYGAAKATGGDLPAALEVTKQALFGVKVGELSAADSTRYLQAIMRGFGADASELPGIFDAINQAQNRFGGSTGDMIAGVAKAAGIFKLAGGDYRELITLITTGTKLTGASGTEVATAISRSASRVLTPQGADALKAQDLDPSKPFPEILAEASRRAQGASREEVNTLARALVPQGGQYARILAPILQNRQLYNQVFAQLAPDKAGGSAARELANALRQPDEQLKRIVVDLQNLGAALAQAGGLNFILGLTKGLDLTLNLIQKVVETWNHLTPAPIRGILAPLLEVAAVLKLMRRLDLGGSLPTGAQGGAYENFRQSLSRSPDQRYGAEVLRGVEDERSRIDTLRRRLAEQGSLSAFQVERAADRQNVARTAFLSTPSTDVAGRADAQARLERAQNEYESRLVAHERLLHDQSDYIARASQIQRQVNEYERLRNTGLTAEAAAIQAGIVTKPGTLERPVAATPERIGGGSSTISQAAAVGLGVAAGSADGERLAAEAAVAQENAARGIERTTRAIEEMSSALDATDIRDQLTEPIKEARGKPAASGPAPIGHAATPGATLLGGRETSALAGEAEAMDSKLSEFTRANGRLTVAGGLLGRGSGAATNAVRTAGFGLQAAGRGLASLASSLGPLDAAIIGVIAGMQAFQDFKAAQEENATQLKRLESREGGVEGIRARVARYNPTPPPSTLETAASARGAGSPGALKAGLQSILHPGRALDNLGSQFAQIGNAVLPGDPLTNHLQQQADAAKTAQEFADRLEEAQKQKRLLYLGQIRSNFQRSSAAASGSSELEAALQEGITEVNQGYAAHYLPKNRDAKAALAEFVREMRARIASIKAARGDLDAAAAQVQDLQTNAQFIGQVHTSFGLHGLNQGNLNAASVGIANARRLLAVSNNDPAAAQEALQQIEGLQSDVQQQVSKWLDALLPYASVEQAGQYRAEAVNKLRTGLNAGLASKLVKARADLDKLTGAGLLNLPSLSGAPQGSAFGPLANPAAAFGGAGANPTTPLKRRADALRRTIRGIEQQLGLNNKQIEAFDRDQQRQQFEKSQALYDSHTNLQASRIVNPVAKIRLQLRRLNSRLAAIAREYGRTSQEYADALTRAAELRDEEISAVLNSITLNGDVAASRDPQNGPQIKAQANAKGQAYLRSKGRQDSDEYKQLVISGAEAKQQAQSDAISNFQAQLEANRSAANIGASQGAQLAGAAADAASFLSFVKSHGGDKGQILGAMTALNQARGAMVDYARQQAQALVQAQGELAKSKTEDPTKQAQIDLRTAQALVKYAQTPAERISALAAVNNARRSARQSAQQEKFNNIEFDASIERIDATTEISRLQALEKSIKGNRELKRTIRKRIFDLQHQTDDSFANLEIGDIKLPTLYDVRRQARTGTKGVTITNSNSVVVHVTRDVDIEKFSAAMESVTGAGNRSAMRSAGVI